MIFRSKLLNYRMVYDLCGDRWTELIVPDLVEGEMCRVYIWQTSCPDVSVFFAQQIPWWNIWYICHSCDWDDWLRYLRFREAIRNLALFGPTPSLFFNPDSSGSWTKKKVRTHPVEVFRYSLGECISMETNMAMENQSFTSFYLYIFIIIHIYI